MKMMSQAALWGGAHDHEESTLSVVLQPECEERGRLRELAIRHEAVKDWESLAVVLSRLSDIASLEDRPETLKWLARVRDDRLNDALGAVRSLEAAVEMRPTDDDSWDHLVVLYDRLGDVRRLEKALCARFRSPPSGKRKAAQSTRRTSTLVSPGQTDERSTRPTFSSLAETSLCRAGRGLDLVEPHGLSNPLTVVLERLSRLFCVVAHHGEDADGFDIPGTGASVRRLFAAASVFAGIEDLRVDIDLAPTSCSPVVSSRPRLRVDPCSFVHEDPAARFAAAAHVARVHPRLRASAFFPSPGRLRVLLSWPQRCGAHGGTLPDLGPLDLLVQASAHEEVTRELEEIHETHGEMLAEITDASLHAWLTACRIAELRAGVAFAGGVAAVESAIDRGIWNPAPMSAAEAISEAKNFAASEMYAQVRVRE